MTACMGAVAAALTELNKANSAARASLGTMTVTAPKALTVRIESTLVTHAICLAA